MPVREKGERLKTNTCVRSHATRLICLAVRQIVRPRLPRASPRLSDEESRGAQLLVVECVVRRAAWLDTRGATRSLVPPLVRRWLNAVDSSEPSRAVRRRVTVFELCFCAVLARDRGFSFARWPASFFRVFRTVHGSSHRMDDSSKNLDLEISSNFNNKLFFFLFISISSIFEINTKF